jgi:hypothetical protein
VTQNSKREDSRSVQEYGAYSCSHCKYIVPPQVSGTMHRNQCPNCLWSLHVDVRTGDRRSGCQGEMEPVGIEVRRDGEWALIHRCKRCGTIRTNRIAGDDNVVALLSLALRPLARPAFPLDSVARFLPEEKEGTHEA